jgi:hypothetical protein
MADWPLGLDVRTAKQSFWHSGIKAGERASNA